MLSNNPVLAPVAQDGGSQHLGERTLHQGMKGHDVRVLQGYLTLAGFPTAVDGDFGAGTKANVVKFEDANGLTDNGVVTYAQSQVLRQVVAKAMTATGPVGKATLNSDGTVTAAGGRAAGRRGRDQRGQLDHRQALQLRRRPRQVERLRL